MLHDLDVFISESLQAGGLDLRPFTNSLTSPAVLLGVNRYNRNTTSAKIPPVFNNLDLCPPVIHDSLMFSTVSGGAVLQPLFLCLFAFA